MPSPELVAYLREQTQQGIPADVLRQSLMESGWREIDIENALHDVAAGLEPLTEGTSLHQDVSQVRAMVAHLASRVRSIEAQLTSVGALPAPLPALPDGIIGPDHELVAAPTGGLWHKIGSVLGLLVLFLFLGSFVTSLVRSGSLVPFDQMILTSALGAVFFVVAYITMKQHRPWIASVSTAAAIATWSWTDYVAWHTYAYMDWTIALGIGVLLAVLALVMGRWIDRLSH